MKTQKEITLEIKIIDSVFKKHNIVRYKETIAKCMLNAMKEYSEQQNAEYIEALKEAVNELKLYAAFEASRITNNPEQIEDHISSHPLITRLTTLLE